MNSYIIFSGNNQDHFKEDNLDSNNEDSPDEIDYLDDERDGSYHEESYYEYDELYDEQEEAALEPKTIRTNDKCKFLLNNLLKDAIGSPLWKLSVEITSF